MIIVKVNTLDINVKLAAQGWQCGSSSVEYIRPWLDMIRQAEHQFTSFPCANLKYRDSEEWGGWAELGANECVLLSRPSKENVSYRKLKPNTPAASSFSSPLNVHFMKILKISFFEIVNCNSIFLLSLGVVYSCKIEPFIGLVQPAVKNSDARQVLYFNE